MEKLTDDADKLLGAVDAAKVRKSVDDLSGFAASLGAKDGPTQHALADAATLVKHLNDTSTKLDTALADLDGMAKAFDAKKVGELMDGAASVGEALKENRGNLDSTLKNAAELTAKLNQSASKIDGLMTSLQGFVGDPNVKGPIGQFGDAAKSIKVLADDMDVRIRQLSTGLVKFSGSGLKEYEDMAVDARKTLGDIDTLIRSIEKNPTQLIFGSK